MAFVLDASVTASWFFPDENDQDAWEAWRRSEKEQMWAPLHWWFEVRNTMLVGERKKRLSKALTSRALSRLSVLPISIDPRPDDNAVFNLARTHRLTFYDAVYLELAARRKVPLATLDGDLIAAAKAEQVGLVTAT
ncbi:MAG: type II toxin-antitoxin system VapC family toxin [Alphaproteobacteria bacterium]